MLGDVSRSSRPDYIIGRTGRATQAVAERHTGCTKALAVRSRTVFSRCSHSRRAPEAALAVGVRAVMSHRNRAESKVLPRCGCVGYLSCSRQRRRPGSGHLHSSAYFMLDVSGCFPSTRRAATAAATAAHVYARCSRAARLAMGARWTVRRLSGQAVRRDRSEAYRTYWGPPASECRVRLRAAYCVHHSNTL